VSNTSRYVTAAIYNFHLHMTMYWKLCT